MNEEIVVYEYNEGESTLIRGIGYNPHTGKLRLKLASNTIEYYDYLAVPARVYGGLIEANSLGGYYNRFIKNNTNYPSVKTPIPANDNVDVRIVAEEDTLCQLSKAIVNEWFNTAIDMVQDFLATITSD